MISTCLCISFFNTLLPASSVLLLSVQGMWILLAFLWSTGNAKSLSLDLPDQLAAWLEGKDELLGSCRRKMEEKISVDDRVVLVEVGDCSQMENPSGHIPHGQFDSDGRLEGKVSSVLIFYIDKEPQGELVITWVRGLDREEERPDMEVAQSHHQNTPSKSSPKNIFRKKRYVTVFSQAWVYVV